VTLTSLWEKQCYCRVPQVVKPDAGEPSRLKRRVIRNADEQPMLRRPALTPLPAAQRAPGPVRWERGNGVILAQTCRQSSSVFRIKRLS
jgi:hypothetical protein